MDRAEIVEKIKSSIVDVSPITMTVEEIDESARLGDDLAIYDLDLMDVIMDIEEACDVDIPDDLDPSNMTVGQLADWVVKHRDDD